MDLPKCKICGEKHRLGFCPQNESRAKASVEAEGHGRPNRPEAEGVSRIAARRSAVGVTAKQGQQAETTNAGLQGAKSRKRDSSEGRQIKGIETVK